MSLESGRLAAKNALLSMANNENPDITKEQAIDNFLDIMEVWIKSATVVVPGTGLTSPSGPVSGLANGTLE